MNGPLTRSTRGIDYQRIPRPIGALADEYADGHIDPRHKHERAQLLYATTGVITVITDQTSFVVPPQRAVWVPAGVVIALIVLAVNFVGDGLRDALDPRSARRG